MTLEELLNKLIEKWWKPFDRNYQRYEHWCLIREFTTEDGVYSYWQYPTTYREFCSKESWLWQFVCENKLVEHWVYTRAKWQRRKKYDNYWNKDISVDKPEYRIIESALCDEDKLEQFLLDNIKVE